MTYESAITFCSVAVIHSMKLSSTNYWSVYSIVHYWSLSFSPTIHRFDYIGNLLTLWSHEQITVSIDVDRSIKPNAQLSQLVCYEIPMHIPSIPRNGATIAIRLWIENHNYTDHPPKYNESNQQQLEDTLLTSFALVGYSYPDPVRVYWCRLTILPQQRLSRIVRVFASTVYVYSRIMYVTLTLHVKSEAQKR